MTGHGQAYEIREYSDMLLIYGECRCVARAAARLYEERYPDRRHPNHNVFLSLINRVRETGCLLPLPLQGPGHGVAGAPRNVRNNANGERILELIEEDPTISVRIISNLTNISKSTVHNVIKVFMITNKLIKKKIFKLNKNQFLNNVRKIIYIHITIEKFKNCMKVMMLDDYNFVMK